METTKERLRIQRVTSTADRVLTALDVRLKRLAFEGEERPVVSAYPYIPVVLHEGYGWTVLLRWKGCAALVTVMQYGLGDGEILVAPRYALGPDLGSTTNEREMPVHEPIARADRDHALKFEAGAYGRAADAALDFLKKLHHRDTLLKERGTS